MAWQEEALKSGLPPAWGWWADEGGYRLDVAAAPNGRLALTVTSPEGQISMTLANFRVPQLIAWLYTHLPPAAIPGSRHGESLTPEAPKTAQEGDL